jgi:hypothetical protein
MDSIEKAAHTILFGESLQYRKKLYFLMKEIYKHQKV